MTRILLCALLAFVTVLAGGAGVFAQDPTSAQQVDVVITVRKPDGSALERAPIILLSQANVRFAFTDDEGNARFSLLKLDDEASLVTGLTMGYGLPVIPREDRSAAISRYHELRDAYAFQRLLRDRLTQTARAPGSSDPPG